VPAPFKLVSIVFKCLCHLLMSLQGDSLRTATESHCLGYVGAIDSVPTRPSSEAALPVSDSNKLGAWIAPSALA
jgi:hypothetical protein